MRLPDRILDTAHFISAVTGLRPKYGGTGFFVGTCGKYGDAYLHFVTAKHVADKIADAPFVLGINGKNGKTVPIHVDGMRWFFHPAEPNAVDVAVGLLPLSNLGNWDSLDVSWINEEMFVTPQNRQDLGIGIGDELVIVGLFTKFHGKDRLFPIVRTGNLAMLPTERIPAEKFDDMEAYLAEGRSIGGLSGSPVFVRETVGLPVKGADGRIQTLSGLGQIYFLGLMHGHWLVTPEAMRARGTEAEEAVNMGVSIIVPAHKIREVIYHPELVAMRKKFDDEVGVERGPVMDSELDPEPQEQPFTQEDFKAALKKVSRKK